MTADDTPAAPDRPAAEQMWEAYVAARPELVVAGDEHTVEQFGDSPSLADALLRLVLEGDKRATAELVAEFAHADQPLPRVGSHWIACDGAGTPRVVLRSVELRVGPFHSADAAFAHAEGEDDRTLDSWRDNHRRYWQRTCAARGAAFSEQDEVVFERFEVVWPPALADR
jgi:uncharacterized protein YhfF